MSEDIRYTPRAKNKKVCLWVALLFTATAAVALTLPFLPAYRGACGMAALILAVAGIFLAVKYLLTYHTYILTVANGVPMFLVEETQGKRSSLVCQIPLDRVLSVKTVRSRQDKAPVGRYYSFMATFGAEEYHLITARGEDGHATLQVKIEADAAFLAALRKRIPRP